MREIVASMFLSLDGVMESPAEWHLPYWSDEMGEVVSGQMADSDAMLLGRVTYEEFAATWPTREMADDPGADYMNNIPKYVVSTTLKTAEWTNSTLISEDVVEEIAKLKQQPGKDIAVSGSATLVRSLLRDDLLDELLLLIHPVVVGTGRHLFQDGSVRKELKLVGSRTFSTGVVALTYRLP
jgi:dihydrofolate reductase